MTLLLLKDVNARLGIFGETLNPHKEIVMDSEQISKEQKHIDLDRRILNLNQVISNLDDLIREVGESIPEQPICENKNTSPTLMDVLNGGPDRIQNFIDRANEGINHLRSLIL